MSEEYKALCAELTEALCRWVEPWSGPEYETELVIKDVALIDRARAALTESVDCVACEDRPALDNNPCSLCGRTAQPPAGEVGELVDWLLDKAEQAANSDSPVAAGMLTWAAQVAGEHADLLEQLVAVKQSLTVEPISLSEGKPGLDHCDGLSGLYCWYGSVGIGTGVWEWVLEDPTDEPVGYTHWLPASTQVLPAQVLPLPAVEVE